MRIVFCCLPLLMLVFTTEIQGQNVSSEEETFFINCMSFRWRESLKLSKARNCNRYLQSLRHASVEYSARYNIHEENGVQHKPTLFSYMSALINWRNEEGTLWKLLLDRVAPCHSYSKTLRKHWHNFFAIRKNTIAVSPFVLNHTWNNTSGEITISPSSPRYSIKRLIAAELILIRSNPGEIEELYGEYSTKVSLVQGNFTDDQGLQSNFQSCPVRNHNLLALDLRTANLAKWYKQHRRNLTIFVQVEPLRQYFNSPERQNFNIVERIAGLVLHFKRSLSDEKNNFISSKNRFLASSENFVNDSPSELLNSTSHSSEQQDRHRRSSSDPLCMFGSRQSRINIPHLPRSRLPCHLVSLAVSIPKSMTENRRVSWPENGRAELDISECVGVCSQPIPDHVQTTNHAILLNRVSNDRVCCVPVSYRSWNYVTCDRGELYTGVSKDTIATKCACQ